MKVAILVFISLFFKILLIELSDACNSHYGGYGLFGDMDDLPEYNHHFQRHRFHQHGQSHLGHGGFMESFLRTGMEGHHHQHHSPHMLPIHNSHHFHPMYRRSIKVPKSPTTST